MQGNVSGLVRRKVPRKLHGTAEAPPEHYVVKALDTELMSENDPLVP
jgi:hypothetical protein